MIVLLEGRIDFVYPPSNSNSRLNWLAPSRGKDTKITDDENSCITTSLVSLSGVFSCRQSGQSNSGSYEHVAGSEVNFATPEMFVLRRRAVLQRS